MTIALFAVIAGCTVARAAALSYEDARSVLHAVSDLHKSGEAGVGVHEYQARAADSLGLPEVSVSATEILGQKTGSLATPLGTIGVNQYFNGPRSSVDSTWSIYTGGRITALEPSPEFKVTVYVSPDDKALAASGWLFGSLARLGRIDATMLTPHQIDEIRTFGAVDIIQVRGTTDPFGDSYFVSNPEVSVDIIAMLRYRLKPNEPGRPLNKVVRPFWRVPTPEDMGAARSDVHK